MRYSQFEKEIRVVQNLKTEYSIYSHENLRLLQIRYEYKIRRIDAWLNAIQAALSIALPIVTLIVGLIVSTGFDIVNLWRDTVKNPATYMTVNVHQIVGFLAWVIVVAASLLLIYIPAVACTNRRKNKYSLRINVIDFILK